MGAVKDIHRRLFERSNDRMVAPAAGAFKERANSVMDRGEPDGVFSYTSRASVDAAMAEWRELTLATEARVPGEIRQGMSHWMFERVYPVPDGNGKIGRVLIPWMLRRSGYTRTACAFIGEAVHEDKQLYVDGLKASRRTSSQVPWLRVFLRLVARNAWTACSRPARMGRAHRRVPAKQRPVPARPLDVDDAGFTVRDAAAAMDVT